MLAYAPRTTGRAGSPRTLLLVAAGHAVALALVLTARSEYVEQDGFNPTVIFVPTKPPPPPPPPSPDPSPPSAPSRSAIDTPPVIIPTPAQPSEPVAAGPPVTSIDPVIGNAVEPAIVPDPPKPVIVRRAARFNTSADWVRPPYPAAKQRLEEEASLRLSLAIDARGRVTSVSPVAPADPIFLDAARRHILRHWRYVPASEGGDAVASTVVITLSFRLED